MSLFISFFFHVWFVVDCIEEVTNRIFSNLVEDLDSTDVLFIPKYGDSIDFIVTTDLSEWLEIIEFLIFLVFSTNQYMIWHERISKDLGLEVLHKLRK